MPDWLWRWLLALLYSVRITRSYFGLRRLRRGDAVKRGFTTEQWLPLTESYPWDPRNFRFLGAHPSMACNSRTTGSCW